MLSYSMAADESFNEDSSFSDADSCELLFSLDTPSPTAAPVGDLRSTSTSTLVSYVVFYDYLSDFDY